jgi:hypothetical protein
MEKEEEKPDPEPGPINYVDDGLGGRFANYEPNLDESVPDFKPGETELSEQPPQTQNMAERVERDTIKASIPPSCSEWRVSGRSQSRRGSRPPVYKDKRVPPPEEMVA